MWGQPHSGILLRFIFQVPMNRSTVNNNNNDDSVYVNRERNWCGIDRRAVSDAVNYAYLCMTVRCTCPVVRVLNGEINFTTGWRFINRVTGNYYVRLWI